MISKRVNKIFTTENNRGFTIVEVLISLSIISIIGLAITSMQASASKSNRQARNVSEAMRMATVELESLMATPYDDLLVLTAGPIDYCNTTSNGQFQIKSCIIQHASPSTAPPPPENTVQLKVTASWPLGASTRSITLDCLKPALDL